MHNTGQSRVRAGVFGAVSSILLSPVAAGLVAAVWRFPVPFADYARGPSHAATAAAASLFYLVLGGFIVVGAAGAVADIVFMRLRIATRVTHRQFRWRVLAALVVALAAATFLASLEYIIGPW